MRLLYFLLSIGLFLTDTGFCLAQTVTWNTTDGSLSVTGGERTFTSYVSANDAEIREHMIHCNFNAPFADFKGIHKGGINSTVNTGGEITLKIYAYDATKPDGKGNLAYGCKSTQSGWQEDYWVLPKEAYYLPSGLDGGYVIDIKNATKSTDIKRVVGYNKIYIPNGYCDGIPLLPGYSLKTLAYALRDQSIPYAIAGLWVGQPELAVAGILGISASTFLYNLPEKCRDIGTPVQPVVVELTVKNATVKAVNIPGSADDITPVEIFPNEMVSPSIQVYKYNFTTGSKGTPIGTSINGSIIDLSSANIKMGDSLIFDVTPAVSFNQEPDINGVPGVWIATDDIDVRYYCTPSVTPGDYKPFLPYDNNVHKLAINQYPTGFDPKEKDWTKSGSTYSWGYTMQRRMDASSTEYKPQFTWAEVKDLTALFPGGNAKIYNTYTGQWDTYQRNAQMKGLNMQFLWNYKQGSAMPKYLQNIDVDEIIYLNSQSYIPDNNASLVSLNDESNGAYQPWKGITPGEIDPLHDMITAYKKFQVQQAGGDPNLVTPYEGYEIEDWGTNRKRGQPGVMCDGIDCEYNAYGWDDLFAAGKPLNGKIKGENKAPGIIKIYAGGNPVQIKLNVASPLQTDYGFYGSMKGEQWIGASSTGNTYTLKGLSGLSTTELKKFSLELAQHPSGGQSTEVLETIKLQDFSDAQLQQISAAGEWTVTFSKGGYKFLTVTAYYQSHPNAGRVFIAGKELTGSQPAYVSAPGSDYKASAAAATTTLPDATYIDLKEGLGTFPNWYETDNLQNSPYYGQAKYGRIGDKFGRTYTFSTGAKVLFSATDKDNQRYITYGVPLNGFYESTRYNAKRIPDDTLAKNGYAKWTVTKVDIDGEPVGSPITTVNGRYFNYTWANPGYYELKYTYLNAAQQERYLIRIVGYNYDKTKIINAQTESSKKANIEILELTPHEKAWLGITGDNYKVAKITDVLSEYMYLSPTQGGGPRGSYNPATGKQTEAYNRFGKYNDYASDYVWKKNFETTDYINPTSVTNWINNYESIRLQWFPQNWVRHHSQALANMPEIQQFKTSNPSKFSASCDDFKTQFDNLFATSNTANERQLNLYWIQYTKGDGYLTRMDTKFVGDLNTIFSSTDGVFTGSKANSYTKTPLYQEASKKATLTTQFNISGASTVTGGTATAGDVLKDQYNFYMDLLNGRKVIIDATVVTELKVYSKGYRNYNDMQSATNEERVFMAGTTPLSFPIVAKGASFKTKYLQIGETFADRQMDKADAASEYYVIKTTFNDQQQFTAPLEAGGNDYFLKLTVPASGKLYVAATSPSILTSSVYTLDVSGNRANYSGTPSVYQATYFTAGSNLSSGASLPTYTYNLYEISGYTAGSTVFVDGTIQGPFAVSKSIVVPSVQMNDANKYVLDKQAAFAAGIKGLVCAHRGYWFEEGIAENTLAAADRAMALGTDILELDLLKTADNKWVMWHDQISYRVSNYNILNQYKFNIGKDVNNKYDLYWGPNATKFNWETSVAGVPVTKGPFSSDIVATSGTLAPLKDATYLDVWENNVKLPGVNIAQKIETFDRHLTFIKGNNAANKPVFAALDRIANDYDKIHKIVLQKDAEDLVLYKLNLTSPTIAATIEAQYGDLMKQIIFAPYLHPEVDYKLACVQTNNCTPFPVAQIIDNCEAIALSRGWTVPAYEMQLKTTIADRHNSATETSINEMLSKIKELKSKNKWAGVTQPFASSAIDFSEYRLYDNCPTTWQATPPNLCSNFDRRSDFDFNIDYAGQDYFITDNMLALIQYLKARGLRP